MNSLRKLTLFPLWIGRLRLHSNVRKMTHGIFLANIEYNFRKLLYVRWNFFTSFGEANPDTNFEIPHLGITFFRTELFDLIKPTSVFSELFAKFVFSADKSIWEFEKLSSAPLQKCFLKGFHCR